MPLTEDDLPQLRDLPSLLTRAEVARVLDVSIDTVDRWSRTKQLETIRLGMGRGRVRFSKRAVLDVLNRSVTRVDRKRAS